jgi:hypothetical protein
LDAQEDPSGILRALKDIFALYPLIAQSVQVGRSTRSEQRMCVNRALIELCAFLATTYPVLGMLPIKCIPAVERLLSTRQWSSVADSVMMSSDASALKRLIDCAVRDSPAQDKKLPIHMDRFLQFLVNFIKGFEHIQTTAPLKPATYRQSDFNQSGFMYSGHKVTREVSHKYRVDRGNKSLAACGKYANSRSKFMPGVMLVFCLDHGTLIGYHVMHNSESPRTLFELFFTRWKTAPVLVCYDNACTFLCEFRFSISDDLSFTYVHTTALMPSITPLFFYVILHWLPLFFADNCLS